MARPFVLGVELRGTGIHPAAWRRSDSRAEGLFGARYWRDLIVGAETAGLDFVIVPDSFALQDGGTGVERGMLDAIGVAANAVAATESIGLVVQTDVTHTEPFHVSKAIASLDLASRGRAGWEVTVSAAPETAPLFGRKATQDGDGLWDEADDAIEVVTRLWDSWEDDAEIRDIASGRFIDRAKLHYIDFVGSHFSVKGPSITPRSPQGQVPVVIRANDEASRRVAAEHADVIRIAASDIETAGAERDRIREHSPTATVVLDVETHLASSRAGAEAELAQLDSWSPGSVRDSVDVVGTADDLVGFISAATTVVDGIVLRPLATYATVASLPPWHLRSGTLRERLGLARPDSRYAAQARTR